MAHVYTSADQVLTGAKWDGMLPRQDGQRIAEGRPELGYVRRDYARLRDPAALRAAVGKSGIAQRELAKRAGLLSHGMVGHLVSGRRVTCRPDTARLLSAALGVPVDSLFLLVRAMQDGADVDPGWPDAA